EESFVNEYAPARTYGFLQDLGTMRKHGLALGGSLDNAIVVGKSGTLNGLRYRDEFVRHKVLDLIGDLALLGKRIIGRVVADRAGHAMHTALVSRILRDRTLWEETTEEAPARPAPAFTPALADRGL
ncbi:MAG TPA: UDP-3-O-acyl-N-acetylglucosamine deacetylase, partial [Terriglobales bacterium]|nr:UDP-3-O-acyl-N-acetylglucosamine deacetylase [Terriglobales bacterium]